MEKRTLHTPDLTARNIERIADLFPQVITESRDAEGNVTLAVDFDLLRQELSGHVVDGPRSGTDLIGLASGPPPSLRTRRSRSPSDPFVRRVSGFRHSTSS